MWKYFKRWFYSKSDPEYGKAYALYRVDGIRVERYDGLERWIVPPFAGQVLLDISGAGGGWATIDEVTPEEAEEIKKQLFDEMGNRIPPI